MGDETPLFGRYHRQAILPPIGSAGQRRLGESRVLLVGCGALGTVIAEHLARGGVGHIRIVDRDTVELSNLQRQTLFDEDDAAQRMPKAIAAANRLRKINSQIMVDPVVADLHSVNAEEQIRFPAGACRVIIDATDNAETRYLLNDLSVRHDIPWIYGACVGAEGRVMPILPHKGPCLRCLFPDVPATGELETCETAGVLGPAAGVVGSVQSALAIRILVSPESPPQPHLLTMDLWRQRWKTIELADARRPECPCCGHHDFEFLDNRATASTITLCGRNAVQIRPSRPQQVDLLQMEQRWKPLGSVRRTPHLLRLQVREPPAIELTLFSDGRLIVAGTTSLEEARSAAARYL